MLASIGSSRSGRLQENVAAAFGDFGGWSPATFVRFVASGDHPQKKLSEAHLKLSWRRARGVTLIVWGRVLGDCAKLAVTIFV